MVFCGGSIQLTRSMRLLPTAPTWIAAISYRSRHSANAAQSSFVLPSAEQSESWPQLGERLRIRRYTWPSRGHSSAGRALPWHGRGRRFDPGWLHCLASERRRRVRPAEHAASDRTSAWLRRKDRGAPVAQSPAGKRRERGPRGDGAGPLLPGRVRLTRRRAQDRGLRGHERRGRRRRCVDAHAGELIFRRGPDGPTRGCVNRRWLRRPLPL